MSFCPQPPPCCEAAGSISGTQCPFDPTLALLSVTSTPTVTLKLSPLSPQVLQWPWGRHCPSPGTIPPHPTVAETPTSIEVLLHCLEPAHVIMRVGHQVHIEKVRVRGRTRLRAQAESLRARMGLCPRPASPPCPPASHVQRKPLGCRGGCKWPLKTSGQDAWVPCLEGKGRPGWLRVVVPPSDSPAGARDCHCPAVPQPPTGTPIP